MKMDGNTIRFTTKKNSNYEGINSDFLTAWHKLSYIVNLVCNGEHNGSVPSLQEITPFDDL